MPQAAAAWASPFSSPVCARWVATREEEQAVWVLHEGAGVRGRAQVDGSLQAQRFCMFLSTAMIQPLPDAGPRQAECVRQAADEEVHAVPCGHAGADRHAVHGEVLQKLHVHDAHVSAAQQRAVGS